VRARGLFFLLGVFAFAAASAAAAPPPWYEAITVNGLVSSSYSYNFNRPPSRLNGFRVFDFDDNSFKVDVAEIVLQKPTTPALLNATIAAALGLATMPAIEVRPAPEGALQGLAS